LIQLQLAWNCDLYHRFLNIGQKIILVGILLIWFDLDDQGLSLF